MRELSHILMLQCSAVPGFIKEYIGFVNMLQSASATFHEGMHAHVYMCLGFLFEYLKKADRYSMMNDCLKSSDNIPICSSDRASRSTCRNLIIGLR